MTGKEGPGSDHTVTSHSGCSWHLLLAEATGAGGKEASVGRADCCDPEQEEQG